MKRIAIIALTFILAGCIMTGCRRNNMTDTVGTDGNTTITTVPDSTVLPTANDRTTENRIGNGNSGTEDAMPHGRINGPGR